MKAPPERAQAARLVGNGCLFLAIFTLLFLALNARFAAQLTEIDELKYRELFEPTVQADVVILGTSHAAHGVHPLQLEGPDRKVYNFAFGGADPLFYERWYELFQHSYPRPKVVLYGADWFVYRNTPFLFRHFEHDSDLFPVEVLVEQAWRSDTRQQDFWLNRFVLFQHRQDLGLLLWPRYGHHCAPLEDSYHGYCPALCPTVKPGPVTAPLNPRRRQAFVALLRRMRAQGSRVILFQAPELLAEREIEADYQKELEGLASQLELPFLNFNTRLRSELNQDPTLYTDWGHLNPKGVERFSRRLAEELSREPSW